MKPEDRYNPKYREREPIDLFKGSERLTVAFNKRWSKKAKKKKPTLSKNKFGEPCLIKRPLPSIHILVTSDDSVVTQNSDLLERARDCYNAMAGFNPSAVSEFVAATEAYFDLLDFHGAKFLKEHERLRSALDRIKSE